MSDHTTVLVRWKDEEALIDEDIAPLVRELWKAGLITMNSCQDNPPGWVWIEFCFVAYAEKFLDIVAQYSEDIYSLFNRIRQKWTPRDRDLDGAWDYCVYPHDLAVQQVYLDDDLIDEFCDGPSNFVFSMSIRFPKTDLPEVEKRLRQYNDKIRHAP